MERGIIDTIANNCTVDSLEIEKSSKTYMFTEEQITKQLVDMREQTDFMKKFRCALGIALQEIKTLRTTASPENSKSNEARKRHASCSAVASMSTSNVDLVDTSTGGGQSSCEVGKVDNKQPCVCSELGQLDLAILKEYLGKMTIDDSLWNGHSHKGYIVAEQTKSMHKNNVEILKSTGGATDDAIRHIERLKQVVLERNSTVAKLCKQLTQARLIRVKRETKLEQKIAETKELKTKYEKVRKANEKQLKITKGLRLALNAERQKVKSSESLVISLDHTRRAFESLKSQAGQLMGTLRDKDYEIAELTAKLEEMEFNKQHYLTTAKETSKQDMTQLSKIHGVMETPNVQLITSGSQTDLFQCNECEGFHQDYENMRMKYDKVSEDFEDYRKVFRPPGMDHRSPIGEHDFYPPRDSDRERQLHSRVLPHNHPYGNHRGRMHAPYTSLNSYKRVSRPPLRRRLHYDLNSLGSCYTGPSLKPGQPPGDSLLSPIEENEEVGVSKGENIRAAVAPKAAPTSHEPHHHDFMNARLQDSSYNAPVTHEYSPNLYNESRYIQAPGMSENSLTHRVPSSVTDHEQFTNDDYSNTDVKSTQVKHIEHSSITNTSTATQNKQENDTVKSFNSQKSQQKIQEKSPSRKSPNYSSKTSYLELGTSASPSPSNSVKSGNEFEPQQPALCLNSFIRYNEPEEMADTISERSSLTFDDLEYQGGTEDIIYESGDVDSESAPMTFGVLWHPALNKTEFSNHENARYDNTEQKTSLSSNDNVNTHKTRKSSRELRCVYYKGHKIDVTKFSIHAFRDIVWSLDGESSDDFIKFLASLAKKLNANPKWAGKHAMGDPKDWLSLRGLY